MGSTINDFIGFLLYDLYTQLYARLTASIDSSAISHTNTEICVAYVVLYTYESYIQASQFLPKKKFFSDLSNVQYASILLELLYKSTWSVYTSSVL